MYTRMAKGLLIILNILGVIAALIIAVSVSEAQNDAGSGFTAFIGSLIGIEFLLLFFGMFVELANNILDIKERLERTSFPTSTQSDTPSPLAAFAEEVDQERQGEQRTWTCRNCGVSNRADEEICEGCGRKRVQSTISVGLEALAREAEQERQEKQKRLNNQTEEPQHWFCASCGAKNRPQANFCSGCGMKKKM